MVRPRGAAGVGGISVPVLAWLSATLAVLALGLTLASRPARASYGRPHFLLTAAILVGVLTSLAMVDVPHVISSESDRTQATVAHTYATLPDTQTFEFGSHTLDLTEVDIDRDRSVRITSELGRLRVLLPRTGNVVVHYRTEMGAVRFDQERVQAGLEMGASWSRIDEPGQPTLTLDLLVEVGALEVVTR